MRIRTLTGLRGIYATVDIGAAARERGKTMQALAFNVAAHANGVERFQQPLRQPGFAAAGKTLGNDERRRERLRVTFGQIGVTPVFLASPVFFLVAQTALAQTNAC